MRLVCVAVRGSDAQLMRSDTSATVQALAVGDLRLEAEPPALVIAKAMKGNSPDAPIGPTKTKRSRTIPIAEPVLDWLETHLPTEADAETPLFTNPRTGRRLSHLALRDGWIKAAKRAGVDAPLYEGTKHSFATDALDRTGDARGVQEVLGHTDPRSTERYAKLNEEALPEVVGVRTVH